MSEFCEQRRVWVLLGSQRGDTHQVYALAGALGWDTEIKQLSSEKISSELFLPPWPDLVISAGYWTEKSALWIKHQSGGKTKCVHLGRSKVPLKHWDLLITTAQYFLPETKNILHNGLPLHGLSWRRLSEAADAWRPRLAALTTPSFALLLGGSTFGFPYTTRFASILADTLNQKLLIAQGSLMISTSKRTPLAFVEQLVKKLKFPYYQFTWMENKQENPYTAFLALADGVFVMGDSMTMLSEATFVNKPLYIIYPRGKQLWSDLRIGLGRLLLTIGSFFVPKKNRYQYAKFHDYLIEHGLAVYWDTSFESVRRNISPVDPLAQAVTKVKKLFSK